MIGYVQIKKKYCFIKINYNFQIFMNYGNYKKNHFNLSVQKFRKKYIQNYILLMQLLLL